MIADLNKIYIYVNEKRISVAAMLAMDKMAIRTVDARGCTGLAQLDLPAATRVYARGCTGLPGYFFAGTDSRGYEFHTIRLHNGPRVLARCRNFSLAKARKHWGRDGPSDRPDCLALVEKIAAWIAECESTGA